MAVISTRVFGDGTYPLMELHNEEFIRQFSWLNGWERIRIGVLWAIQGSGTFTLANAGVGICSSASPIEDTEGFKSAVCKNAVIQAISLGAVYSPTSYVYNAGSGTPYYSQAFTGCARKQNASWTTGAGSGAPNYMAVAGTGRSFFFADFIKAGGISGKSFMPTSSAQGQFAYTMGDLYEGCQQARSGALYLRGATVAATAGGQSVASASELPGVFDCVSVWWDNAAVPIEIYGIVVYTSAPY